MPPPLFKVHGTQEFLVDLNKNSSCQVQWDLSKDVFMWIDTTDDKLSHDLYHNTRQGHCRQPATSKNDPFFYEKVTISLEGQPATDSVYTQTVRLFKTYNRA